ncbi:hypothetical protein L6R53_01150 [Myxococcota bacterium]|nr:hypothetical protein [Myxococcota bacterium]
MRVTWVVVGLVGLGLACGGGGGGGMQSSPEAIALARQLGFPDVQPGMGVAGPLAGPEGSIYYASADGKVSYFLPGQVTAWFATLDGGGVRFHYALTPTASYRVDAGKAVPLSAPPPQIGAWPYSGPIVNVMVAQLQAYQQGRAAAGGQGLSVAEQAYVSGKLHEINMNILENMGSQGCTEYYEDGAYVGCW